MEVGLSFATMFVGMVQRNDCDVVFLAPLKPLLEWHPSTLAEALLSMHIAPHLVQIMVDHGVTGAMVAKCW